MMWQKILAQNNYRWWLVLSVSVGIFLLGNLAIGDELAQWQQLFYLKNNLAEQLNEQSFAGREQPTAVSNSEVTEAKVFRELFHLARMAGVDIRSMKVLHWQKLHGFSVLPVNVVFEASFADFLMLVDKLLASVPLIIVQDYSLAVIGNGGLRVEMKLIALPLVVSSLSDKGRRAIAVKNPFCVSPKFYSANIAEVGYQDASLTTFALSELKVVGYLAAGNREVALVSAPNGQVFDVAVGSVVGVEKARVVRVGREGVSLSYQPLT